MLRFFSQRTGIRKMILWGFIGILILGLGVAFAVPSGRSYLSSYVPISGSTVVASVDGYAITISDLRGQIKAMGRNQQSMSGSFQDEPDVDSLYPQFGKSAIDTLINARIVRREADRLSLGASTQEMRDYITTTFVNPGTGKWIGQDEYQTRLRLSGYSVESFERDVNDQLTETKLRNFLTSGVAVSDREIEDDYRRSNTSMKPTYVLVAPKPDAVPAASEEELRAYFDSHKGDFRINTTQRKITYLFVSQDALGATIPVSDDELRKTYESDKKKYVSAVHVQQIVFKVPAPAQDADVRKKAEEVANSARPQGDKPGADFAELAKQNSQDAATAANGGDAGFVEKASLKPGDPRERLFSLDQGQTSSALKVGDSYVVYKVLESRAQPFEEARGELLRAARQQEAYSKGVEVANQAEDKLRESKDPQRAANEVNASLNAPADAPVVTVRETPYAQAGDQLPDIGSNPQFDAEVSALANKGDVGDTVGVTGGFAVPMLADVREPHDATYEEVRDRVAPVYRTDRAKQTARDTAQRLATESTSPADLQTRAKALGLEPKTQENFKAGGTLPEMQPSDLLDTALLATGKESVAKNPVEMPNGFLVLAVADRTEADMGDAFTKAKDSIRERLAATKAGQIYSEYMKNLRERLQQEGRIVTYQDTIDRAFALAGGYDEEEGDGGAVPTLPPAGAPRPATGPGGRPIMPTGGVPPGMPTGGGAPGMPPGATPVTPQPAPPPAAPPAKK